MPTQLYLPQLTTLAFPPVESALQEPDGLLAWGGDLSPQRLLLAYRLGIFPWSMPDEPLLWWNPSQRMVLPFEQLNISHSMRKLLKKLYRNPDGPWQIKIDTDFSSVIQHCASTREYAQGTWISEDFIIAYTQLHHAGITHSIETWYEDTLVGGLYGVSIGKMFFGESMFSHQTDSSKLALIFLMYYLAKQQVFLIDCQQETGHLTRMGGTCISRRDFSLHLDKVCSQPPIIWEKGIIHPQILDTLFLPSINLSY
ncbi:leucyl/phenylalanyl-tRNA--protein transferase [Pelistega ratti]|uniref:leucyl/phenylalanyl-tRNA--protein transferase n=1 Tax=Pelistega ratti TaxID=2652177 RepID=UPI0013571E6B|nr:leucyl/phenylalanyl-tRNA--protein transferase [Pelistega ratti]